MSPVARVAVASPLRRYFDYLLPPDCDPHQLRPGVRVRVPFGSAPRIGILVALAEHSEVAPERLKPVLNQLDQLPLLPATLMELARWTAAYYQHPPGPVLLGMLPGALRRGAPLRDGAQRRWRLTPLGAAIDPEGLARAPRQAALLRELRRGGEPGAEAVQGHGPTWRALAHKGWIEECWEPCLRALPPGPALRVPELNQAQANAVAAILAAPARFHVALLDGVTGSGKTEVYLRIIEEIVRQGRQALVLVPEIGLTPQTLERFQRRLKAPVAAYHSGLTEGERLCSWTQARAGQAAVLIGTRSAVFAPLARPGLVIVDEEHDPSFKQAEGLRYSARDLAVLRGRLEGIPVLLGSATPSLDSLHNALQGKYRHLSLPERAGIASQPSYHILDVRGQGLEEGLSEPMLTALRRHLQQDGQALLFLNRRGFAPTLVCHDCGWLAACGRCDARLTLHQRPPQLRCHHCTAVHAVPLRCPDCGGRDLRALGLGTERVEAALRRHLPSAEVVRIDRDSVRRRGALEAALHAVRHGREQVLIGTQMLAKGHDFPGVTMTGIVDADAGLFSTDFRAAERTAQLFVQVAGRAGRRDRPGEVYVQTRQPRHPLLLGLIREGYARFAEALLAERRAAALPPYVRLALLRAEASGGIEVSLGFLEEARKLALALDPGPVQVLGPIPAPMPRRAGRYRAQLLLQAPRSADLQRLLGALLASLERSKAGRQVRWSVDVDPVDLF